MAKRKIIIPNWQLCDVFDIKRDGPEFIVDEIEWTVENGPNKLKKGYKCTEEQKKNYRKSWTKERREAQSKMLKKNPRGAKPVTYKGKKYPSVTAAAKAHGVSRSTIANHLSGKTVEGRKARPRGKKK